MSEKERHMHCIYRAGCPKPDVCAEVGHCTSQTRPELEAEKALSSNQQCTHFAKALDGIVQVAEARAWQCPWCEIDHLRAALALAVQRANDMEALAQKNAQSAVETPAPHSMLREIRESHAMIKHLQGASGRGEPPNCECPYCARFGGSPLKTSTEPGA